MVGYRGLCLVKGQMATFQIYIWKCIIIAYINIPNAELVENPECVHLQPKTFWFHHAHFTGHIQQNK